MNRLFFAKLFCLFVLGLIVVFLIDPLDRSTVSTPFLLGIILTVLSLRQDVSLVLVTSLLYTLLTVYALLQFRHDHDLRLPPSPHPAFWLFQRGGLFLVICTLGTYLAHFRTSTERNLAHFQSILGKLPAPVVISDAAGYITYVNDALVTAFKAEAAGLPGKRYVDYFMSDIQEGKAMRYYIELFGTQAHGIHDHEVRPFGGPVKMHARLTCLGTGPGRIMITLLQPDGE